MMLGALESKQLNQQSPSLVLLAWDCYSKC